MGLNYGWLFDIQSPDELFDYLEFVRASRARAELAEARKFAAGQSHANVVAFMAQIKGITVLEAQLELNSRIMRGMEKVLFQDRRLFVNSNGGYFGVTEKIKIHESRDIDVWALPEEKPRFVQWTGGTHWYAKIGDEDIVVNGRQKWDTKAEAEAAAAKYLKGKKR